MTIVAEILADRRIHTTSEIEGLGASRTALARAVRAGDAVQYARGVYVSPGALDVEGLGLAAVSAIADGVVCLMSAAQVHGLSDEDPTAIWFAVDRLRTRREVPSSPYAPVRTVWWPSDALAAGVETRSIAGIDVRVTDPARTVVDLLRFRDRYGEAPAISALHDFVKSEAGDVQDLWATAERLGAAADLSPFLSTADEISRSIPLSRRP